MTKRKLTDADRVILASAGARETGLVLPVPKSLKLSPTKLEPILRALLAEDLVLERPSLADEDPWVRSEDGGRSSLIITAAGLEAVGLGNSDKVTEIVADADTQRGKGKARAKQPSPTKRASTKPTAKSAPKTSEVASNGRTTKLDILIGALRQRKGATIAELMDATGWQAHSVRGSISGALKKRMSLNVTSKTVDGRGRVYRIESETAK
jgi:hypothetical protein